MSRRVSQPAGGKMGRGMSLLWIGGMVTVIILLLYFEQTALLYVISTLGVTALLVIVALADLEKKGRVATTPADDAAALGTGIASAIPADSTPRVPRVQKRK